MLNSSDTFHEKSHDARIIKKIRLYYYWNFLLSGLSIKNKYTIDKITALWAFSEAALGGILHALRIPFTGLFIGGSAVIFISLIAYFGDSRRVILESTVKVILVKFIVSPYSPINAYFAVMLQSMLGYLLFYNGFNKLSPILLGLVALLFSALQKVIILTLVFGMTLWESIDIFFDFVLNKVLPNSVSSSDYSLSYLIVGAYILSHLIGGLLSGWYASNFPSRITNHDEEKILQLKSDLNGFLDIKPPKKKRKWWLKTSSIIMFIFAIIVIAISFLFEEVDQSIATQILIMLVRSILIILVWYYFISPVLLKLVKKILLRKQKQRANEIDNIIKVFPNIKLIIKYSWEETKTLKGLKRIIIFFDKVLIHYLLFEQPMNEE